MPERVTPFLDYLETRYLITLLNHPKKEQIRSNRIILWEKLRPLEAGLCDEYKRRVRNDDI